MELSDSFEKDMIKNIILVAVALTSIISTSCTEPEPTHEERIDRTVRTYLDDLFSKETAIASYEIDSIEINNISPKVALKIRAIDKNKELQSLIDEAKELKKKYQDKKELANMYTELGQGEDAFTSSMNSDLEELNEAFKAKKEEADLMLIEVESMYEDAEKADSTSIQYYEVIARGSVINNAGVKKSAIYPFHISKDYHILREPIELINRQRE